MIDSSATATNAAIFDQNVVLSDDSAGLAPQMTRATPAMITAHCDNAVCGVDPRRPADVGSYHPRRTRAHSTASTATRRNTAR